MNCNNNKPINETRGPGKMVRMDPAIPTKTKMLPIIIIKLSIVYGNNWYVKIVNIRLI